MCVLPNILLSAPPLEKSKIVSKAYIRIQVAWWVKIIKHIIKISYKYDAKNLDSDPHDFFVTDACK
jgi:hypothetical protein